MDRRGVLEPPTLNARYDRVSGGAGNRLAYYLARRHLGLSPGEWDDLPWWQQKMFWEGYEQEGLIESADGPSARDLDSPETGATAILAGEPGEMESLGFQVHRL